MVLPRREEPVQQQTGGYKISHLYKRNGVRFREKWTSKLAKRNVGMNA
jgi:hypothetical protein